MKLIHDDDVELVRVDVLDALRAERLNGGEDVRPLRRLLTIAQPLAEGTVAQDETKDASRLIENLFPMCDEEQGERPLYRPGSGSLASFNRR